MFALDFKLRKSNNYSEFLVFGESFVTLVE